MFSLQITPWYIFAMKVKEMQKLFDVADLLATFSAWCIAPIKIAPFIAHLSPIVDVNKVFY